MARKLKVHGIYRHFKGNYYIVEGLARHSEDLTDYVVYRRLYANDEMYVGPSMGKRAKRWGAYKGFKGEYYVVEGIVNSSEDLEKHVLYRQLYCSDKGQLYIRPLKMFMSEVDHKKYPGVKQRWRFEEVKAL